MAEDSNDSYYTAQMSTKDCDRSQVRPFTTVSHIIYRIEELTYFIHSASTGYCTSGTCKTQ